MGRGYIYISVVGCQCNGGLVLRSPRKKEPTYARSELQIDISHLVVRPGGRWNGATDGVSRSQREGGRASDWMGGNSSRTSRSLPPRPIPPRTNPKNSFLPRSLADAEPRRARKYPCPSVRVSVRLA